MKCEDLFLYVIAWLNTFADQSNHEGAMFASTQQEVCIIIQSSTTSSVLGPMPVLSDTLDFIT